MQYAAIVTTGLVLNMAGPFPSRDSVRKWGEKNQVITYMIVPLLPPDLEEEMQKDEKKATKSSG